VFVAYPLNSVYLCLLNVADEEGLAGMDWNEEEGASLLATRQEYDCVICSQTTTSTEDKPMGLVVLVQVSIAQCIHYLLQAL
jgi:hypothetical protein